MKKILILMALVTIPSLGQTKNSAGQGIAFELSEKYRISVLKEDIAALTNMLHPDVVFYPPKGPMFRGSEKVGSVMKSFLDKNDVTAWSVEILNIREREGMIFEFGQFEIEENGLTVSQRKYLNIWELHKNEYRLSYRGWSPLE